MNRSDIIETVFLTAMNTAESYIPMIIKNPKSKKAAAIRREAVELRKALDMLIESIPEP